MTIKTSTSIADHQLHPVFFSDRGVVGHPKISWAWLDNRPLEGDSSVRLFLRGKSSLTEVCIIEETDEVGADFGADAIS